MTMIPTNDGQTRNSSALRAAPSLSLDLMHEESESKL